MKVYLISQKSIYLFLILTFEGNLKASLYPSSLAASLKTADGFWKWIRSVSRLLP